MIRSWASRRASSAAACAVASSGYPMAIRSAMAPPFLSICRCPPRGMPWMLLTACRRVLTLAGGLGSGRPHPPRVKAPGRRHDQVSPRVLLAIRFLAVLPMTMPTTSVTRLEMIREDAQAIRPSLRLVSSLMVTGAPAVAVLMVPPAPPVDTRRLSEGGDEDGFDGVEAVFGLVEDDAGGGVEDLAGDFEASGHAGVLHDLAADGGVGVVVGGQAVHEFDGRVAGGGHEGGVDLVGGEDLDPVGPDVFGFAHGYPHVGVDEVGAGDGLGGVVGDGDGGAGAGGDVGGQVGDVFGRVQFPGAG